ncbi:MAG: hypothetical protein ACE5L6_05800 [Candidatus Bathyarchaeia archaeon]
MLYIWYFNLKNGVSEEEFVNKSKELLDYLKGKVEGLGSGKFYRHHFFGANLRTYQMHMEVKDFGTWDRFLAFIEKDAKGARLFQEWRKKFVDMKTHFDEFVREIPPL